MEDLINDAKSAIDDIYRADESSENTITALETVQQHINELISDLS
jgi:hypothetical protein